MSKRVDFYLLKSGGGDGRLRFGCRITQKALNAGHKVYVLVADRPAAAAMDELLWTFSQQSFVPHAIAGSQEATHAPVLIGTEVDSGADNDVLVVLVDEVADGIERYARVIEIVGADDQSKAAARHRYQHYRNLGLEPNTHHV